MREWRSGKEAAMKAEEITRLILVGGGSGTEGMPCDVRVWGIDDLTVAWERNQWD